MRVFTGLILGVLITIGAAYIHDSSIAPSMTGPDESGLRMVNWEAVSRSFNGLSTTLRDDWNRLLGRHGGDHETRGA